MFTWISIIAIVLAPAAQFTTAPTTDLHAALCGGGGGGSGGDHHGDGDHHDHDSGTTNGFKSRPKPGTAARCPVLKQNFKVSSKSLYSKYKGRYYVFCCASCKPKFDKNPSHYTHNSHH